MEFGEDDGSSNMNNVINGTARRQLSNSFPVVCAIGFAVGLCPKPLTYKREATVLLAHSPASSQRPEPCVNEARDAQVDNHLVERVCEKKDVGWDSCDS